MGNDTEKRNFALLLSFFKRLKENYVPITLFFSIILRKSAHKNESISAVCVENGKSAFVCVSKLKVCMYSAKENATERVRELHENFFLGNMDRNLTDETEEFNENLPSFNVWILTVSSLSLAAMFAITGGVFAVVNAVRNSAELVFGFVGVLIWNALGAICALVAIFSWLVQYLTKFRRNVMTLEELEQHWVSEYRACVGFSYYLVVISAVLFMITVSTLGLIIKQPWVDRKLRSELRKKLSSRNFVQHSASSTMTKKSKDGIVTV